VDRHRIQWRVSHTPKADRRPGIGKGLVRGSDLGGWPCRELETFECHFDWFANCYETQVIASDGEFALLGTMLLVGRRLHIDYQAKTVELS
jgi:hypothetical protein